MLKILVYILISYAGLSASQNGRIRVSLSTAQRGEQDSIAVNCDADNAEKITWYSPKNEEIVLQWKKEIYTELESENQLRLVFANTSKEDSGNYTCLAKFKNEPEETKVFQLQVRVKPKFSDRLPNVYYASPSDNVTLQCEVNLQPHPPIAWQFNDELLKGPEYKVVDDGESLLVMNVSEQHFGTYKCVLIVAETGDVAEREMQLKEAKPPTMITVHQGNVFRALLNTTAQLRCKVTADPSATITWFRNEKAFKQRDYPGSSIEDRDNESILKLLFSSKTLTGPYKCEATNMKGNASSTLMLLEGIQPNVPTVHRREAFESGFRFDFHEGGEPQNLTNFRVYYKKRSDPNASWQFTDFKMRESETVPYSLNGLEANTVYVFKVGACTDIDVCAYTEESTFKTSELKAGSANSLIQTFTTQFFSLLPAFIISFYSQRH